MKKKVFLNHDGGVDDLVSLFLLLQMEDVDLLGVGVIPADCYLEPAMHASRKIVDRFGNGNEIEVAASTSRGKNPFPKDWRMHAFYVDALPILNEFGSIGTKAANLPAHQHMIKAIRDSENPVTLVFIGPLTDLARALEEAPDIETNIEKLVWMGGTFLENGNVEEPEHDGTAEWNAFWDPQAAKRVWDSSISIDLVALESTNMVPLTPDVRNKWASQRKDIGIDFMGQCYAMVPPLVHFQTNSTYFLWDVLTTATIGKGDLVKKKKVKSIIHADGPSQGKTEVSETGRVVNVVYEVKRDAFFDYITELARQNKGGVKIMRRIIIDTDTAGDDTIALLTALHHFKVEGVTITGGNVDFDQEVENALYTIQVAKHTEYVPVYKGYEGPIIATDEEHHQTVEDVHGRDGMGDSFFEKAKQRPETGHAVDFIIERVKANPGEIFLLAIAPLTNIAMAIKKDPTIAKDIPHIYIMGGTNNSLGNITAAAEYNFYVDPEAARLVLHSGIPITMVGWDMCTKYSIMDDNDHLEIEQLATAGSDFFIKINQVVMNFNKEVHRLNGTTHPDTLLVAIAANESLMTASTKYYVDIETKGELTRGYNMVDINNRSGKKPNVRVCEAVDREGFKEDLLQVLRSIS